MNLESVADLDDATFDEDVAGLQIAVNDSPVVQEAEPVDQSGQPLANVVDRHAVGITVEHLREALAGDIFHDDPVVAVGVVLDVENRHEVGMLQVEALRDAAKLDVKMLLEQLERHFFAAVGECVIDFAEASAMDGPLDRVAVERLRFRLKGEFHRLSTVSLGLGNIVRKGNGLDRHGSYQPVSLEEIS
jgi:hypothetical protein